MPQESKDENKKVLYFKVYQIFYESYMTQNLPWVYIGSYIIRTISKKLKNITLFCFHLWIPGTFLPIKLGSQNNLKSIKELTFLAVKTLPVFIECNILFLLVVYRVMYQFSKYCIKL